MGTIGFIIGIVAAYSFPSLAQFVPMPDGSRPPEQRSPMTEPMGDRRPPPPDRREGQRDGMAGRPQDQCMPPHMGEDGAPNFFGIPNGEKMREPMGQDKFEGINFDPSGQGMNQGMNPERDAAREAEEETRQKRQEAQQEQQKKRMLEQMKRGMQQASRGLESMKKMFDKWKSKNVALPVACTQAYSEARTLVDTVLKAESPDALEDLSPEDLQDYMHTLQECRQTGERLMRLPQLLKRVDAEIKSLEKSWIRAKRGASDAVQDTVKEGDLALQAIKEARTKVTDIVKSGEIDDIEALVEDEIYGKLDDVRSHMQSLEAARNAKRYMLEYVKQIRAARSYIDRLRKLGKDVGMLEDILTRAQAKYEDVKKLKPGSDAYQEAVEELAEIGSEFAGHTTSDQDFGAELDGKVEMMR